MIKIKPAEINDLPVIRNLAYEIWPSAYGKILGKAQLDYMLDKIYSASSLEHQMAVLKHQFILVFENKKPIGFAAFSAHINPLIYHLNKIYVLPDQQGKNAGKQILNYVTAQLPDHLSKLSPLQKHIRHQSDRAVQRPGMRPAHLLMDQ